jgi:hypothetical protein
MMLVYELQPVKWVDILFLTFDSLPDKMLPHSLVSIVLPFIPL